MAAAQTLPAACRRVTSNTTANSHFLLAWLLPLVWRAARKSSVEVKATSKNSEGFQVKVKTGISFFGIAGTQVFGEVKCMWSQTTGQVTGEAVAYSASPSGTVTVKPAADGKPGNCSIIEVSERSPTLSHALKGVAAPHRVLRGRPATGSGNLGVMDCCYQRKPASLAT